MSTLQLLDRNGEMSKARSARPAVAAKTARPNTKLGIASPVSTAKVIVVSNEGAVFGNRSMGVKIKDEGAGYEKNLQSIF